MAQNHSVSLSSLFPQARASSRLIFPFGSSCGWLRRLPGGLTHLGKWISLEDNRVEALVGFWEADWAPHPLRSTAVCVFVRTPEPLLPGRAGSKLPVRKGGGGASSTRSAPCSVNTGWIINEEEQLLASSHSVYHPAILARCILLKHLRCHVTGKPSFSSCCCSIKSTFPLGLCWPPGSGPRLFLSFFSLTLDPHQCLGAEALDSSPGSSTY